MHVDMYDYLENIERQAHDLLRCRIAMTLPPRVGRAALFILARPPNSHRQRRVHLVSPRGLGSQGRRPCATRVQRENPSQLIDCFPRYRGRVEQEDSRDVYGGS